MKISFVIPCYNSEKTIEAVIIEIKKTVREGDTYEIILVNDCSRDKVWEKIKKIAEKDKKIKAISFAKNFGQHSALMAGYRNATGEVVVSVDDDGQIPVDETYALINKINEGYDVVYASYANKKHSFGRNIGTKLNNLMCETMLGKPKEIMITSFFVAKAYIIREVVKYNNPFAYVPGLVLRNTNNIASVPVTHRERMTGRSGYNLKKLIGLWVNGFTSFSVLPLRIATVLGFISATIGFVSGLIVIFKQIFSGFNVPVGYSSLMAVILFIGGIIMLMLGLIGEYLGRIYISINNSPQYIIKEEINTKKNEDKNGKDGE